MLCPLFARVLLRRSEIKIARGLVVPDAYKKRNAPSKGTVIAKGPTASPDIKVGGVYIFGQHAGAWVNENGTPVVDESSAELYICQDEDLLCEVEK